MKRKFGLGYFLATCLGLAIQINTANAGVVTVHTSRADFNAVAGATTLEDFNSFTSEVDFLTAPLDVGDFTISTTNTFAARNFIDLPPVQFTDFDIDGTNVVNAFLENGDTLFLTFDVPITAFGADFGNLNDFGFEGAEIFVAGETFIPCLLYTSPSPRDRG